MFAHVMVVTAAVAALAGAQGKEDQAADSNAAVAKASGGKVWVKGESIAPVSGDALRSWLAANEPDGQITRKTKDGPWTIRFRAVFKKVTAKGPMTVQFFEKGDPKNIIDQYSPPNDQATHVFVDTHDLEPDMGFNKAKTYVIKVGQIIKGKFVTYATGSVSTK